MERKDLFKKPVVSWRQERKFGSVTWVEQVHVGQIGSCVLGAQGSSPTPSGSVWKLIFKGFPGGSDGNESACNAGDMCSIPGLGRSPGEGIGNPSQCPCLENPWTEEPGGLQSMALQRVGHE